MSGNDYPPHPLASLFPMTKENTYEDVAFREMIRLQGFGRVVLLDGMVLGGLHELRACRELGLEPRFEEYVGDNPLVFVLLENFNGPCRTSAQRVLFVEENTTWTTRGGDRKSAKKPGRLNGVAVLDRLQRYAKPGTDFSLLIPFSFSNVEKLHAVRNSCLKNSEGKDIPSTRALLSEIIDSVRSGRTESVRKVLWLAGQSHENQRKYLANIKFKGQKIERRKRETMSDAAKIARVFDAATDEEKARFLKSSGLPWWRDHKHEHGG
jgi:hypothetical protein